MLSHPLPCSAVEEMSPAVSAWHRLDRVLIPAESKMRHWVKILDIKPSFLA